MKQHQKKSWESFHARFLCCHGGRDFYTCLLEGNMESTSLDGCNWVLLGNDLDLFKTIQKKHG